MNITNLLPWALVALLAAISIILLTGRGAMMIAGYNTLSRENKKKFNEKKLCRVVGSGTSVITVLLGIAAYYKFELPSVFKWIMPFGILGTVVVILILELTICRVKPYR